jgi:kumamolisin
MQPEVLLAGGPVDPMDPGDGMGSTVTTGGSSYSFGPADLSVFYDNTRAYTGAGQAIVIAGAYAWNNADLRTFNAQWALPALPSGSGQVCTGSSSPSAGCVYDVTKSLETALAAEYAHATAPGAKVLNYMAASTSFADFAALYNRIVTGRPGQVVTTSWGACEATMPVAAQQTNDNIFANANAIGQSWFAASGDGGSRFCRVMPSVAFPANSPHLIGVGGTTATCSAGLNASNPACVGYGSERAWSGSTGGVSQVFVRPAFQAGCAVPAGTQRLVPDVALASDPTPGIYLAIGGAWYAVGGTSGAAPQWAGFFAQLNQQKGRTKGIGNPGARLYALCGTPAFHDVISGSNGDYSAARGYDLVTGLGSIEAKNLLAAF